MGYHDKLRCFVYLFTTSSILTCSSGCANKIDTSFVAERWSTTLSAYNIDPVFPPRYIQVGDVYLVVTPREPESDKDRYKRRAIRLGRADVRFAMQKDMQTALQLPLTTMTTSSVNVFDSPSKVVRLPPTAYPGFNIAEVTEADLGVAFPVKVFRALFGLAGGSELAMSISIPNAEDIDLAAYDAFAAFKRFCTPDPGELSRCDISRPEMQFFMRNIKGAIDPKEMIPKIVMLTHVYYARQIEYSYTTKAGAALAASVSAAASLPSGASGADAPKTTTKPDAAGSSPPAAAGGSEKGPATLNEAQQEVQALNAQIDDLKRRLGTVGPGGTTQFVVAGSKGVILRQTFDLPVAIGYRGLWIEGAAPTPASPKK